MTEEPDVQGSSDQVKRPESKEESPSVPLFRLLWLERQGFGAVARQKPCPC